MSIWGSSRSTLAAVSSQADVDAIFVHFDAGDVVASDGRHRPNEGDAELLLLFVQVHGDRSGTYRGGAKLRSWARSLPRLGREHHR
jgi:hypothetical protein